MPSKTRQHPSVAVFLTPQTLQFAQAFAEAGGVAVATLYRAAFAYAFENPAKAFRARSKGRTARTMFYLAEHEKQNLRNLCYLNSIPLSGMLANAIESFVDDMKAEAMGHGTSPELAKTRERIASVAARHESAASQHA